MNAVFSPEPQTRPQPWPGLDPGARLRLDPAACLSRRYPGTGCRSCVDACPVGALAEVGGPSSGPSLRGDCLGCGRCVAACPSEALAVPGLSRAPVAAAPARPGAAPAPLAIDCWRVPWADSPAGALRVPCLGGLSATWLLEQLAESPQRPLTLLDRGFCTACPVGGAIHPASAALAEVGRTLATLRVSPAGPPRLVQFPLPPERMDRDLGEPVLEIRVSRRSLFVGPGRVIQPPGVRSLQAAVPPEASQAQPQRRLAALSRLAAQPALPAALFPTLAAGADCSGHWVCAAACPTGAIREYRTEQGLGTDFDAAACIACGVCTRLCPEQALTLLPAGDAADTYPGPQPLTRFALSTCPDCGADYQGDEPACPACLRDHSFARDAFRTLFDAAAA